MSSASLLVVDDEDLVRWSLRAHLIHDGYSVREATTVAGAVEQTSPEIDQAGTAETSGGLVSNE
jgi:DNA-binding NtrC family response regulator